MRTIAILKPFSEDERKFLLSALNDDDRVLFFENEQALERELECESDNIEIVFGEPDTDIIGRMKKLRWIQMTWAGANKYTSSPELFRNVELTSASGAFGKVISEHIVSGILELYRNLRPYRKLLQSGGWEKLPGDDTLEGKRVLILGTGNIGSETAKKMKCFGAVTVGISRTKKDILPYFDELYCLYEQAGHSAPDELGQQSMSDEQAGQAVPNQSDKMLHSEKYEEKSVLDEQLKAADVIILALPGTIKTRGLIDERRISLLKKDSVLVNVGRGFVVDTGALTNALLNNAIRGAVLDVVDPEPLPEDHPLRNMENVVLTPHVSGISWGDNLYTRKRILDIFCENLKSDSRNDKLKNKIDFSEGY